MEPAQISGQNQLDFPEIQVVIEDPLDFLLKDDLSLRRKPRSSCESQDRAQAIPPCHPLLMPPRRDSGRSRRDLTSPQLSPMGRQQPIQNFNLIGEKPSNFDCFDLGSEGMLRSRLPSETEGTCQSSTIKVGFSRSGGSFGLGGAPIFGDDVDANMAESDSMIGQQMHRYGSADLWMRDSLSIQESISDEVEPLVEERGNVLSSLQPVSVPTANEDGSNENSSDEKTELESLTSTMFESCEPAQERAPVISREGLRKQKHYSPASMIHHTVRRTKKTPEQVKYLRDLFDRLGGEWNGKIRKEAMLKTGLSRIQIYKWFFDTKQQMQPKAKRVAPEERVSYPCSIVEPVVPPQEEAPEAGAPRQIFLVERVTRC